MPFITNLDKIESIKNKVNIIDENSTEEEYPSAAAVHKLFENEELSVNSEVSALSNTVPERDDNANIFAGLKFKSLYENYPTPLPVFDKGSAAVIKIWNGQLATGFASGTGTKYDPYIIETPDQFAYMVKGADGTTNEKFYKIADGIDMFDMNGMVGITINSTLEDVKVATINTGYNWSIALNDDYVTGFRGNFDGNGLIIYNIYGSAKCMGLFPAINGSDTDSGEYPTTIKNIAVTNCYFTNSGNPDVFNGIGGIFGVHRNGGSTTALDFYIENCSVTNCYLKNTYSDYSWTGCIGANIRWKIANIINCLVAGNEIYTENISTNIVTSGLIAISQQNNSTGLVYAKNSIVLGIVPFGSCDSWNATDYYSDIRGYTCYPTNLYSDCEQPNLSSNSVVNTLSLDEMNNDNCMISLNFDWNVKWFTTEFNKEGATIPHSVLLKNIDYLKNLINKKLDKDLDVIDSFSSTPKVYAQNDSNPVLIQSSYNSPNNFVLRDNDSSMVTQVTTEGITGGYPTPTKALVRKDSKITKVLTWSGAVASSFESGSGTKIDPFIIATPEQLAYLCKGADGNTRGNYYKIADGIDAFNMNGTRWIFKNTYGNSVSRQPSIGDKLSDYEIISIGGNYNWSAVSDNIENAFAGHFDGNGIVIYNLYSNSAKPAALFPYVGGNILYGDVDGDGKVNWTDYKYLLDYINNGAVTIQTDASDFDGDGEISDSDLVSLMQYLCGYDVGIDQFNTTICNLTIKNGFFCTQSSGLSIGAGAIIGAHTNLGGLAPTEISNCAILDTYVKNSATGGYAGALVGSIRWHEAKILNCLVADNVIESEASVGGLIGVSQSAGRAINAKDCVIVGTTAYPTSYETGDNISFSAQIDPNNYINIYTDQDVDTSYTGITKLDISILKSNTVDKFVNLKWGFDWFVCDTYSGPAVPYDFLMKQSEGLFNNIGMLSNIVMAKSLVYDNIIGEPGIIIKEPGLYFIWNNGGNESMLIYGQNSGEITVNNESIKPNDPVIGTCNGSKALMILVPNNVQNNTTNKVCFAICMASSYTQMSNKQFKWDITSDNWLYVKSSNDTDNLAVWKLIL